MWRHLSDKNVDFSKYPDRYPPEIIAVITEEMDTLTAAKFLKEAGLKNWALKYAEEAVAENPNSFEALLLRTQLLPPDRKDEKEAGFHKLLEINPNSVEALLGMSSLLYCDRPQEGIIYSRKVLELDPSNGYAYTYLGFCYERLGQYKEALEAFKKAYQITQGERIAAHISAIKEGKPVFSVIQSELNEREPCRTSPNWVSPYEPQDQTSTLKEKGKLAYEREAIERRRDEYQRGLETWYKRIVQEDPKGMALAHYEYARELMKQGKIDEAIYSLYRAIELNPDHPDSYRELAKAYEKVGYLEEAAILYQEALKRFPKNRRLQRDWEAFRRKYLDQEKRKSK